MTTPPAAAGSPLTQEERRWLHDKYERLAAEEGQLAAGRTSYFATIGSVLVTGTVVALAYFGARPDTFAGIASFLASIGILISVVWAILLHRTNDAQALWREAARRLEETAPPLEGSLPATVTLRSGEPITVDLVRPYSAHQFRFARSQAIGRIDRVNPARMSELLPLAFLTIWVVMLLYAWAGYFFR